MERGDVGVDEAGRGGKQRIARDQLTIHADRGSSMTSKPVAFLLADLGVTKTHSRPYTSTDCSRKATQRGASGGTRGRAASRRPDNGRKTADQRAVFTACHDARRPVSPGAELELAVDHNRFHVFDPSTGLSLDTAEHATLVA